VIDRAHDLSARLDGARAAGLTVGLVPTMGALHQGHLSLVRRAAGDCDVVVVTVFVNPLQFGPGEDLATYPRDLDADIEAAGRCGADLVFAPSVAEMYPEPDAAGLGLDAIGVDSGVFDGLTDVFEGASRPGHFAGVARVVARLFGIAGACRAYFGEKDWQQVLVVRRLVEALALPVEVVTCPTVRDADGLACSSRNARLSPDERRAALALSGALSGAAALAVAGEGDPTVIRRHLVETVAKERLVRLDYAAVVAAGDLTPVHSLAGDVRLLLAATVGATRLIDNVGLTPQAAWAGTAAAGPEHERRSA
jgi:pantoate--beta-alanine ligase